MRQTRTYVIHTYLKNVSVAHEYKQTGADFIAINEATVSIDYHLLYVSYKPKAV